MTGVRGNYVWYIALIDREVSNRYNVTGNVQFVFVISDVIYIPIGLGDFVVSVGAIIPLQFFEDNLTAIQSA